MESYIWIIQNQVLKGALSYLTWSTGQFVSARRPHLRCPGWSHSWHCTSPTASSGSGRIPSPPHLSPWIMGFGKIEKFSINWAENRKSRRLSCLMWPDVLAACAAEEGVVGGHLGQHLVHAVPELHPPPGLHSDWCWARVTVSSGGGCVGRRLAPWCWMLGPSQGQPSLAPASAAMCKSCAIIVPTLGTVGTVGSKQDARCTTRMVSCSILLHLFTRTDYFVPSIPYTEHKHFHFHGAHRAESSI